MKQSPATIKKYAESVGVEFGAERVGREWSVDCYAPVGQVWRNHGTHFLALSADGFYGTPNWAEVLSELQSEVAAGFAGCVDPECDICQAD